MNPQDEATNHKAWSRSMIGFIRERGLEREFQDWCGGWACPVVYPPHSTPGDAEVAKGGFACPICDKEGPHHHGHAVTEAWRSTTHKRLVEAAISQAFSDGAYAVAGAYGIDDPQADHVIKQAFHPSDYALATPSGRAQEPDGYQVRCLLPTGNHPWRYPALPSELSCIMEFGTDEAGIPYAVRPLYAAPPAQDQTKGDVA